MPEDDLPPPRRDDISRHARSLARLADRLPNGKLYILFLFKPTVKGDAWRVKVTETRVRVELEEEGSAALSPRGPATTACSDCPVGFFAQQIDSPDNGK
jgi:hypothetical protein